MMTCRRCSECAGSDHHWMDNGDFGNDPVDAEGPTGNEYVCKHCDAVGDECPACEGAGEGDVPGSDCPACRGECVVIGVPRDFDDLTVQATTEHTEHTKGETDAQVSPDR